MNYWRDPNIECGPFRALPRTDGKWIVIRKGAPNGQGTVSVHTTKDEAKAACKAACENEEKKP